MNFMKLSPMIALAATLVACGGANERDIDVRLEAPVARESKIALRPALDVSSLYDPAIADRLVIEEIDLNISSVRLLGADARIPAGGFPLLTRPAVLQAFDGETPSLELPFPAHFADQDDLAVYVRIDQSEALMNASVVIRGRIYAQAVKGGLSSLTATENDDTAVDEDEDNGGAKKEDTVKGIDPDGDPADPCGIDPDGDPADPICGRRRHLTSRGEAQRSVPFELRGEDVADLVSGVDENLSFDVVIGIPASRWFTPEAMRAIDAELRQEAHQPNDKISGNKYDADRVLIEARMEDRAEQAKEMLEHEYFVAEERPGIDALKVRRTDRPR